MNIGSIIRRAVSAFGRSKTGGHTATRGVHTTSRTSSPQSKAAKGIARTVSKKL